MKDMYYIARKPHRPSALIRITPSRLTAKRVYVDKKVLLHTTDTHNVMSHHFYDSFIDLDHPSLFAHMNEAMEYYYEVLMRDIDYLKTRLTELKIKEAEFHLLAQNYNIPLPTPEEVLND